jgi:heat shock protein HslJ
MLNHQPTLILSLAAIAAVAGMCAAETILEDTNWIATEVMGKPVTASEGRPAVGIQLHSLDKKMTGFSGCNKVFGPFEASHEGLKLGPVAATRVACLDPNVETQFLEALTSTRTFRIAGDELQLQDMDGKVIGRFRAGASVSPDSSKEASK